jgi:RNA polymerase primary sigma factor
MPLSDAAIKKLIRSAKKRGYVTHDQINSVLPSEEVNSEQIEDVLAMFREMGISFVETQEPSKGAEPGEEGEASLAIVLVRLNPSVIVSTPLPAHLEGLT